MQAQRKLQRSGKNNQGTGLTITIIKTKVLRFNARRHKAIKLDGTDTEKGTSFVYIGAFISNFGGAEWDIRGDQ